MKVIYILIALLVCCKIVTGQEIIEREQDVSNSFFGKENFKKLDADFAMDLLNQQAKTMLTSIASKAAAAVPYIGSAGVAMEVGASNLKLDELIVANKNYNYKLTSVLGNILKVTKESRDGTIVRRAKNAAKKIEIVDQTLKTIKKCQRTRDVLRTLGEKGWTTTNMLRAVNSIDGTLNAIEKISSNFLRNTNSISEEIALIDNSEKELEELNKMLDNMYADAMQELNEKVASQYAFEYTSNLITSAMYLNDMTQTQGKEKYNLSIEKGKDGLTAFKNIMWLFVLMFFMCAATANVWKVYFSGDDSITFIRYTKAWIVGLAICIVMATMLDRVSSII